MLASQTRIPDLFGATDLPNARWRSLVEPWTDECPDPAHWIATTGLQRTRSLIEAALREGSNPILLSGPTGHGKTFLLRSLRSLAPREFAPLLVPISNVEPEEIARWVLSAAQRYAVRDSVEELTSVLLAHRRSGWKTLLLLDEVQSSPPATIAKLFEILDAAGTAVTVILAALPGAALDHVLAAIPHLIRRIEIAEPWTRADAELLLAHVAPTIGISASQLIDSIDVAAAVRAGDGNPRLVRAALGQQLRTARLIRASDAVTPAPAWKLLPATLSHDVLLTQAIEPPRPIEPPRATVLPHDTDPPKMRPSPPIVPMEFVRSDSSDPIPSREISPVSPSPRLAAVFDVQRILRVANVRGRARRLFDFVADVQRTTDRGIRRAMEWIDLLGRWRELTGRVQRARAGLAARGRGTVRAVFGNLDRRGRRAKEAAIETLVRSRRGAERAAIDALDRGLARARQTANEVRTRFAALRTRALLGLGMARNRLSESSSALRARGASTYRAQARRFLAAHADAQAILRRGNRMPDSLVRSAVAVGIGVAGLGAVLALVRIPLTATRSYWVASSTTSVAPSVEPIAFRLNSDPWAIVEVDGATIGSTPVTIQLKPGSHRFRAMMADGRVKEEALVVSADRDHHAFR